jgi:hypothetical protein
MGTDDDRDDQPQAHEPLRGITGGHLIEWSRWALRQPPSERHSEPWEHLRERRFNPTTYLNELTRAEYRELFGAFEILEERVTQPALGREHFDARPGGAGGLARREAFLQPNAVRAATTQNPMSAP